MGGCAASTPEYVCGHSAFELERLARQDRLYGGISRQMLEAVGLAEGMQVLDLGCGGGELSLLAAEYVGGSGRVVGVDRAQPALALARSRAVAARRANVEFIAGEIDELATGPVFDAIIGRFVLMHQRSAPATLLSALRCLRESGKPRVAFLESDLAATLALAERCGSAACAEVVRLKMGILEAAGARTDLGLRLGEVFCDAGLPAPTLWLHGPVAAAGNSDLVRYMLDSLRSLNASARRLGQATLSEAELSSLAERMEQDGVRHVPVFAPVVVSAVL
jgi:SAM-dependent methyltransferase